MRSHRPVAVTDAFLDAYQALHADATIDTLNVWEENLPDFDSEAIDARKYKGVSHKPLNAAEAGIWELDSNSCKTFSTCGPRIHVARRSDVELAFPYKLENS